jgi:hypothetical protein
MTRSQIRQTLRLIAQAFNNMREHTQPRVTSTWAELAEIIGQESVTYIRTGDPVNQARQVIAAILDCDETITTDGEHVYTSMPMTTVGARGWQALQPALLRVIKEPRKC